MCQRSSGVAFEALAETSENLQGMIGAVSRSRGSVTNLDNLRSSFVLVALKLFSY